MFEWVDGPLIKAMIKGSVFLADEISLADDSVLERLNSLLGIEFIIAVLFIFNVVFLLRTGSIITPSGKRIGHK